jgi:IMP dehydrogenase
MKNKAFTFDDVSLVPQFTEAERGDIDIRSSLLYYDMKIPIISSPMDTVSGLKMLVSIRDYGVVGIHHRYCEIRYLEGALQHGGIAVSPSKGLVFIENLMRYVGRPTLFCLDVAHGHTKRNLDFAHELIKMGAEVISGNIVTEEAAEAYLKIGVKALRVGIGSGSACTTRVVTGVGIPQLTAIQNIYDAVGTDAVIISDGGHRTTGDIVKALAFGADFVMLGGMLAGTDEAEGGTHFRGMASAGALSERKKEYFVEGISKEVQPKGSVVKVLDEIKDAIETACYYLGASNLKELKGSQYVYVTQNGWKEGLPQ